MDDSRDSEGHSETRKRLNKLIAQHTAFSPFIDATMKFEFFLGKIRLGQLETYRTYQIMTLDKWIKFFQQIKVKPIEEINEEIERQYP